MAKDGGQRQRHPKKSFPPSQSGAKEDPADLRRRRRKGEEQTTGIKGNDVLRPSTADLPSRSREERAEETTGRDANNIGARRGGGGGGGGGGGAGETDDERPPSMQSAKGGGEGSRSIEKGEGRRRRKQSEELRRWSDEDRRVFAREVGRWNGKAETRDRMVGAVWAGTSGQVHRREQVEEAVRAWEAEEERRKEARETLRRWREDRKRRREEERAAAAAAEREEIGDRRKEDEEWRRKVAEEHDRRKERVREWREMRGIKEELKRAGQVVTEVGERLKRELASVNRRVAPPPVEGRGDLPDTKAIDERCRRHLREIDLRGRRERALEVEARWLETRRNRRAEAALPPRRGLGEEAKRDPERLLRQTRSYRSRLETPGDRTRHVNVEDVFRRGVPEWRRQICQD